MKNIYLAGPLFSDAERAFNQDLARMLRGAGYSVYLPQEHEQQLTPGYAARIFAEDVRRLNEADAIVAVLDGHDVDSGTAWECGYAYAGWSIPVFGFRTDFRTFGPEEKVNLMVQECCEGIYDTLANLLQAMEEYSSARESVAVDGFGSSLPTA